MAPQPTPLSSPHPGVRQDGRTLHVGKGVTAPAVLAFDTTADGGYSLMLEDGARAVVIERVGAARRQMAIHLGANAVLDYALVQKPEAGANSEAEETIVLGAGAKLNAYLIQAGGGQLRRSLSVAHKGAHAVTQLAALSFARGKGRLDFATDFTHAVPDTESLQTIRSLADGQARAAFLGNILVAHGAQHTLAEQNHGGLLLDDGAEIYARPGLEIYADDVKCGHGNSCGALDEDSIFYLRSRGMTRADAERLLLHAFAAEPFTAAPAALHPLLFGELAHLTGVAHEDR